MRLQDNLVLRNYIAELLGGDYLAITGDLKTSDEGRRPDGQSAFYGTFESRRSRLKLSEDGTDESLQMLKGYDLNILAYESQLARNRPTFRLKYFQYLAVLYAEIYFDRLTRNRVGLLLELEAYRTKYYPKLPAYKPDELYKMAYWMATGAGKTLLMHINLLQFRKYRPIDTQNILLLTPTEDLTRQHLSELHQSGFDDAIYALNADAGHQGVQVLEITKLYVEGATSKPRKGGLSLPTSQFLGPNLLLVDEGHKGTATKTQKEEERSWRDIRTALAADGGFTLEYSATFAQVTENDESLLQEYTRAILFEYAYAQFHADGYGKDFNVLNLRQDDQGFGDTLLLSALLTLYEQKRFYDFDREQVKLYNIASPLMVFVGAQVTAGPEVKEVVQFLDRVLRDQEWTISEIQRILEGELNLTTDNGDALFADRFLYIRSLNLSSEALYGDLCDRLFGGSGALSLHMLSRADGEIGLRVSDSSQDTYCGIINVGEAKEFSKKIQAETNILVGDEDHLTDSLFAGIEADDSPVNFLIGSKKFGVGWSSWRVSVMGLLRVGSNAGAEILQLFGRGVRLKGRETSLRRSSSLPPDLHSPFLPLLETLGIFGLKANYLESFLKTLDREGVEPLETRILAIEVLQNLAKVNLKAVQVSPDYDFRRDDVVSFDTALLAITHDLTPKLMIGSIEASSAISAAQDQVRLSEIGGYSVPYERLYYHALNYKSAKDWGNLFISRASIRHLFEHAAKLKVTADLMYPTLPEHHEILDRAGEVLVEKALERFYYQKQREAESQRIVAATVGDTHPNFPRVEVPINGQVQEIYAYQLKVPKTLLEQVEQIINDQSARVQESLQEPLPRLHVDVHLYWPLLVKGRIERLPNGTVNIIEGPLRVTSIPMGLEESEVQFVEYLEATWKEIAGEAEWGKYQIYLLRNLPKKGIGFFQTGGFYPDFLLWLVNGQHQAIAFIDPKGMSHGSWEKVSLLQDIRELSKLIGSPILAYIVTPTPMDQIPISERPVPNGQALEQWLRDRHVLNQNKEAIRIILVEMRRSLIKT